MRWLLALPALAALTACGVTKKSVAESAVHTDSIQCAHASREHSLTASISADSTAWEADSAEVLEERRADGTVTTRLRALRLRSVRTHAAAGIARTERTDTASAHRNIKTETVRAESVHTIKPWCGGYAAIAVGLLVVAGIIFIKLI